jgi:hypothetical protein
MAAVEASLMVKGTKTEQRGGRGGRAPPEAAFYCTLCARGPRPQLDAPPPERTHRAVVGVGRWTRGWRNPNPLRRRGRDRAWRHPARRNGVGQIRGRRVSCPNSARFRRRRHTSHCGWLPEDAASENKTLVPLCGADAIAGGRADIVSIVDAGFFRLRYRSNVEAVECGWAESFDAPLVKRRGKLDNSMPKLEAQEIKHRANPQPIDNPAPCRSLGRAFICCWRLETLRFRKETWSVSPRLLSSHPRNILLTSSPFPFSNDPINNNFGAVNDISNPQAVVLPCHQSVNMSTDAVTPDQDAHGPSRPSTGAARLFRGHPRSHAPTKPYQGSIRP